MLFALQVFHDEKVLMKRSWVEADFFCQALGAQLASFHHYEEQVFVKELLSTMFEGLVQPSGPHKCRNVMGTDKKSVDVLM